MRSAVVVLDFEAEDIDSDDDRAPVALPANGSVVLLRGTDAHKRVALSSPIAGQPKSP